MTTFDKNHLPVCEHKADWEWKPANYDTFPEEKKFDELCNHLSNLIGSDCWAVTIGKEVIFNNYIKNYKAILTSSMLRTQLSENMHYMVHQMDTDTMRIYMFVAESWTVDVNYDNDKKAFVIQRYNSYLSSK